MVYGRILQRKQRTLPTAMRTRRRVDHTEASTTTKIQPPRTLDHPARRLRIIDLGPFSFDAEQEIESVVHPNLILTPLLSIPTISHRREPIGSCPSPPRYAEHLPDQIKNHSASSKTLSVLTLLYSPPPGPVSTIFSCLPFQLASAFPFPYQLSIFPYA